MALVLDHFRNIPQDVYSLGRGSSDSVPALVGCVTTAATHAVDLDEESVFDLVVRASDRVDEVVQIMSWLSKENTGLGQHATRDALSALKMALGILAEAWDDISAEERQNLLEMARLSLARFCSLSRPRRAISPV